MFFGLQWVILIAAMGAVRLRRYSAIDCSDAPIIVALFVLGPVPALAVAISQDFVEWPIHRYRGPAFASNIASFVLAIGVAAVLLAIKPLSIGEPFAGPENLVLAATIGICLFAIQYFVGTGIMTLLDGIRLRAVLQSDIADQGPTQLAMLFLGLGTCAVYWSVGFGPALALLAVGVMICQSLVPAHIGKRLSKAPLDDLDAKAQAIAGLMNLDRRARNMLAVAACVERGNRPIPQLSDFRPAMDALLYSHMGTSAGNANDDQAATAGKVLAVARAWQDLTDRGVSDDQAIQLLCSRPEDLDRGVINAAANAVYGGSMPTEPEPRFSDELATPRHGGAAA